jgi:uncharacterized protein (TIGR03435 family)
MLISMLSTCTRAAAFVVVAVASASAQQAPTFEVASVKPSAPLDAQQILAGKQRLGMRMDAGRVDIDGLPLSEVINIAFRTKSYQVTAPNWVGTGFAGVRVDIHATLPAGASTEQVPEMLQTLLAERFKLAYHREKKEDPVFALIVGKGGSKLVESPPDPPASETKPAGEAPPPGPASGLLGRGGSPPQIKGNIRTGITLNGGPQGAMRMSMSPEGVMRLEVDKLSMSQLADTLTRMLDRPVVDQTGLTGNYKVALELARDDLMSVARAAGVGVPAGAFGAGPGGPGGAPAAADPSGSSVFRSVEQLGLKLDSRKAPIEHIVIDHLERTPTED